MDTADKARQRLEVILKVQGGHLSATDGAKALGVSRKTYYEWEKRAMEGLLESLTDRETGRPTSPEDPEKVALKEEVADLKIRLELFEKAKILQQILDDFEQHGRSPLLGSASSGKKKTRRRTR